MPGMLGSFNVPRFNIEQTPTGRAFRPLQQPETPDPANLIMQAAGQNINRQALQQKAQEAMMDTIMTGAKLQEERHQHDIEQSKAEALLDLQNKQYESEAPLRAAKTQEALSNAAINQMFAGNGSASPGQVKTFKKGEFADPANPLPGMSPMMWSMMAKTHNGDATWDDFKQARGKFSAFLPMAQALATIHFPEDSFISQKAGEAGAIKKATAEAAYEQGGAVQTPVRLIDSLYPLMNRMRELRAQLPDSGLATLNKYGVKGLSEVQNPIAQELVSVHNGLTQGMKFLFPGQIGSDLKLNRDIGALPLGIGGAALDGALNGMKLEASSRQQALLHGYKSPTIDQAMSFSQMAGLKIPAKDYLRSLGNMADKDKLNALLSARQAGLVK